MLKLVRTIGVLMMIGGAVCLLGTAGASDLNNISFEQMIVQLFIAITMFFVGFAIVFKEQVLDTCAYLIAQVIIKYREVKHR